MFAWYHETSVTSATRFYAGHKYSFHHGKTLFLTTFLDFFEVCITDSYKYLFYTSIVSIISIAQ